MDNADKLYVAKTAKRVLDEFGSSGGGGPQYFCIWAGESSSLSTSTSSGFQWSFGNGETGTSIGPMLHVPSGYTCHCVAMSLTTNGSSSTNAVVELVVDGVAVGSACAVTLSGAARVKQEISTPYEVFDGERISFRTTTAVSGTGPCTVCAWFKLEAA